jgi:putative NADPH-quinone reductase
MKVLVVYAHPISKSFCHAVLDQFIQGLAFIAPVYWCHFPAILKGWFESVFNYGFAVEHDYFYAVNDSNNRSYLERAYLLDKNFAR